MSVTMKKTAIIKTYDIPRKKSLLLTESRFTSSLSLGRRVPIHRCVKLMYGLLAFELALEDKVHDELDQILDIDVYKFYSSHDNLLLD